MDYTTLQQYYFLRKDYQVNLGYCSEKFMLVKKKKIEHCEAQSRQVSPLQHV